LKIWRVHIAVVTSKKDPDFWESWANVDVVAETIEEAVKKAVEHEAEGFKVHKIRADKAELFVEADVE